MENEDILRAILRAMDEDEIYFRVHWSGAPAFSAENASSAPWGDDECERVNGYSCMQGARALVKYFASRGDPVGETVYVFRGRYVGAGPDNEPLVVPDEVIATMKWEDFTRFAERADY